MYGAHNYLLWEDEKFIIRTPLNPHIPYSEGLHIVIYTEQEFESAWQNEKLASKAFEVASTACRIMSDLKLAPWFNIQANGNWGLLPGATPIFHIHVYGRNKTKTWAKPIVLPEAPKTFQNAPMPEDIRNTLVKAFAESLNSN